MTTPTFAIKGLLAGAILTLAASLPAIAAVVDVNGYKFDDMTKVAGKDLKLNGAGMRTKFIVKVYAAGLYLPEKKNNTAEILKEEGPRRVTLQMARDISSEDFGKAFMDGLNENIDKAEKQRIVAQISKIGEIFASVDGLKKGDVLHLDWIPGTGTQAELNGQKLGGPIPDINFYNAILRIWLGDKPVDRSLKPALAAHGIKVAYEARISADDSAAQSQIPLEVQQMKSKNVDFIMLTTGLIVANVFVQQADSQRYTPQYMTSDFASGGADIYTIGMPASPPSVTKKGFVMPTAFSASGSSAMRPAPKRMAVG